MKQVTDGITVYEDYYFERGQLYNNYGHKIKPFKQRGSTIEYVKIIKDGKKHTLSLPKLKRWSCPDKKLRALLKRVQKDFVPVFGFEDIYKFNPQKPTEVFNIKKRTLMKVFKFKNYLAVAIKFGKDQNTLIHQMVVEHHFQKHIDTKKYDIHHLSHRPWQNDISNLIVLPTNVHIKFENYYKCYKGTKYFSKIHTKQEVIDLINSFNISKTDKQRLIDSL